jgi:hypothetical protein
MRRTPRSLVPALLLVALAATLVFAATAAAEIRIGEGDSLAEPAKAGEVDLLRGTAEYDSTTGTASIGLLTRQAPESVPQQERESVFYTVALVATTVPCTREAIEAEGKKASEEKRPIPFSAVYEFLSPNQTVTTPPHEGIPLAQAYSAAGTGEIFEGGFDPVNFVPASKTIADGVMTLSGANPKALGGGYNCVLVQAQGKGEPDVMVFPLTTKPEPPAPPAPPAQQAAPETKPAGPAPGVLALAKGKALKAAAGKWTAAKVTFTNSGGSAIPQGTLQVRAPKGVIVKPARQRTPALLPGESWTETVRVRLTAKAKATSTLALTASAGGLTAQGALVFKRAD